MKNYNLHLVINPKSASGRTGRILYQIKEQIEKYFGQHYTLCIADKKFDARDTTCEAIKNGCGLVVVAGGDGTIQNTINGFFHEGSLINPECKLGIVNSGTGSGFAQSFGLPVGLREQIELITRNKAKSVDIGKITYHNGSGEEEFRYFINECQIGIGGKLVKDLKNKYKKLGGFLAFGLGTFGLSLIYNSHAMTINSEKLEFKSKNLGVSVLNGSYTGGGMNLAPEAQLNDNKLDVLVIKDQPVAGRITNLFRIYSGKHIKSNKFNYFQVKNIEISSEEEVFVGADGEYLGTLPCTINIIPSAINICSN